jgi:spore germination protein (amino acid permease)
MGIVSGVSLVLIATAQRIFLETFTEQIAINGQAAWIGLTANSILALVMMLVLTFLVNKLGGDLLSICKTLVGRRGALIILLFLALLFAGNTVLLLRNYVESTKISALHDADFHLISLTYGFTAAVAAYYGIEVIARAGCFVIPVLVAGSAVIIALLYPFYQFYLLVPLLGNGLKPLMVSSLKGAGFNLLAILIIIIAPSFQNVRTVRLCLLWGFGGMTALKLVYIIVLLLTFGVEVGMEKILPFFELARLVFINHYLQRIEAPLMMVWVMFGVLAIGLSLHVFCHLVAIILKLPSQRPLVPMLAVLTIAISMLPENFNQVTKYEDLLVTVEAIGIYFIPLLLLAAYLIKGKNIKCSSGQV